jgi:hypothetical protein
MSRLPKKPDGAEVGDNEGKLAVPKLGRGRIKGYQHPLDRPFQSMGFRKSGPPSQPKNNMLITIWPTSPYFIWHPSGPDYDGLMFGYKFVNGRIPGSVPGQVAETMKAMGCRVEDYIPGMDIVDWNPVETGGFEPKFTTDKPEPEPVEEAVLPDPEPEEEIPAPPDVAEVVEEPGEVPEEPQPETEPEEGKPQDYSLLDKDALKALCSERGLKVDRRSIAKMLFALEESDK